METRIIIYDKDGKHERFFIKSDENPRWCEGYLNQQDKTTWRLNIYNGGSIGDGKNLSKPDRWSAMIDGIKWVTGD